MLTVPKVLIGVLIALSVVFLGLQIMGLEIEAAGTRAVLFIVLTLFYCISNKKKHLLFISFMLTFTLAEVLNFFGWFNPPVADAKIDYLYYFINSLYILAYSFLIWQILASLNLLEILKKYTFHLIVLVVLDVFSVIVVTNTTLPRLTSQEYSMELVYNTIIMILLTVALINFIHKSDKKAINLLVGAICIFFSEVIQLAYFYVSALNLLNVICSIFLLLAFLFFLVQAYLSPQPREQAIPIEI